MNRTQRALEDFLAAAPWYLALAVAIGILIWISLRIKARFRDGADPAGDPQWMLSHFRELQRQGGLSEEEFRSIKGRLMDRIDGSPRAQDALPHDRSPHARTGEHQGDAAAPPDRQQPGGTRKDEMTRHDRPTAKES
ncbi:MAG: hypothetical protein WD069_09025 [Planctomycetales bacterium]